MYRQRYKDHDTCRALRSGALLINDCCRVSAWVSAPSRLFLRIKRTCERQQSSSSTKDARKPHDSTSPRGGIIQRMGSCSPRLL